jgi:hypothetical protein
MDESKRAESASGIRPKTSKASQQIRITCSPNLAQIPVYERPFLGTRPGAAFISEEQSYRPVMDSRISPCEPLSLKQVRALGKEVSELERPLLGADALVTQRAVNLSRMSNPYLDSRISRPLDGWRGRAFLG